MFINTRTLSTTDKLTPQLQGNFPLRYVVAASQEIEPQPTSSCCHENISQEVLKSQVSRQLYQLQGC